MLAQVRTPAAADHYETPQERAEVRVRWSGQLADAEGKPSKTFQEETEQVVVVGREGEAQAWWAALLPTCKQAEVAEVTVQPSRGSAADLRTPLCSCCRPPPLLTSP